MMKRCLCQDCKVDELRLGGGGEKCSQQKLQYTSKSGAQREYVNDDSCKAYSKLIHILFILLNYSATNSHEQSYIDREHFLFNEFNCESSSIPFIYLHLSLSIISMKFLSDSQWFEVPQFRVGCIKTFIYFLSMSPVLPHIILRTILPAGVNICNLHTGKLSLKEVKWYVPVHRWLGCQLLSVCLPSPFSFHLALLPVNYRVDGERPCLRHELSFSKLKAFNCKCRDFSFLFSPHSRKSSLHSPIHMTAFEKLISTKGNSRFLKPPVAGFPCFNI